MPRHLCRRLGADLLNHNATKSVTGPAGGVFSSTHSSVASENSGFFRPGPRKTSASDMWPRSVIDGLATRTILQQKRPFSSFFGSHAAPQFPVPGQSSHRSRSENDASLSKGKLASGCFFFLGSSQQTSPSSPSSNTPKKVPAAVTEAGSYLPPHPLSNSLNLRPPSRAQVTSSILTHTRKRFLHQSYIRSSSDPSTPTSHNLGDHPPGKTPDEPREAGFTNNPPQQPESRFLHTHHRPTKEQLLATATGFWSRLKVRFKWFSIRSVRPFTFDEIAALFSWVILGHILWIVFATTTFFSLLILAINTVFAQETLARWVGNYLTKSSGLQVVFESAIVPRWRGGVITFKKVFVSRRPGSGKGTVSKGSSSTAATEAAAAAERDASSDTEDGNYTQFDVSIENVNVTLSFAKWFNGKGLLRDVEMNGVRGVVDRTHVSWPEDEELDPAAFRHPHYPGDFELDSFKVKDLLVTVYQPNGFRPFPVSIFLCELPQLRRRCMFYDLLCASTMSGSYDNSLFTIHPRQTLGHTGFHSNRRELEAEDRSPWKKHNRIRIDGLCIDHLNSGIEGPFGWIREGTADIIADFLLPAENDESLAKVMADVYDRLEETMTTNRFPSRSSRRSHNSRTHGSEKEEDEEEEDKRVVVTDFRMTLNNVRAQVPLFTRELSYINSALIRPIVAYINTRQTFIPITCRVVKRIQDFDGSWTAWECGLMDDLSAETYEAFARDVMDEQVRRRRLKKVGLWSLQLAVQAIFMGMASSYA